jgi:hypothetical protein
VAPSLPMPLNRVTPKKPSHTPYQDVPLETTWKLIQMHGRNSFYLTSKGAVRLWAPQVPVADLKKHYREYTPISPAAVFTSRDEYWCPHCAAVKTFKWLACTDDHRCEGCGVPNYDKKVVEANYGSNS